MAGVETSWDERSAVWLARAYAAAGLTASARRLAESLRAPSDRLELQRTAAGMLRELAAAKDDAAGVPVLPALAAGEQRTRGRVVSIDCGNDWLTLVVEMPRGTSASSTPN